MVLWPANVRLQAPHGSAMFDVKQFQNRLQDDPWPRPSANQHGLARNTPPGRRSISHAMVSYGAGVNQHLTCSGGVHALSDAELENDPG